MNNSSEVTLGKRILVSANMGPGTLRAKIQPLAGMPEVDEILILRKEPADVISKVRYLNMPKAVKNSLVHLLLHPLYLAYYARKYKVDVIIGYHFVPYAFFAHIASRLSGKPFIVAQTGLLVQNIPRSSFKGRWISLILKRARFLYTPGKQSRNFWEKWGVDPLKIRTLHSTIDTGAFQRIKGQEKYDFVFVGRLNPIKQIDLIISGFHRLHQTNSELKLLIVGGGPIEEELKNQVERFKLNSSIDFAGFQTDVKGFLDKAPFFIMASKSEGLPCAIMEAMSNGNIVLSTLVGNIPDLIDDGVTGIAINSGTDEAIYEAMKRAINLKDEDRQRLVRDGRKLIEDHHSFSSAQLMWREVFTSLKAQNV